MGSLDQYEIDQLFKGRGGGWDESLRYNYPLNANSTVWDVGGWHGDFSWNIYHKFRSNIHIFEVLDRQVSVLRNRFSSCPRVRVHEFGLGDKEERLHIRDTSESTSTLVSGSTDVTIRPAARVLGDRHIDLMKINVEGYEYRLLRNLAENDKLKQIEYLQIQFHDYVVIDGIYLEVPNAPEEYEAVQAILNETHRQQWCYPYVWESWARR